MVVPSSKYLELHKQDPVPEFNVRNIFISQEVQNV